MQKAKMSMANCIDHGLPRYYSDAILGCLHRSIAMREWSKLKAARQVDLERALVAFDLFILHDRKGDFDEVGHLRILWRQTFDGWAGL
jgi:hypothetical protein